MPFLVVKETGVYDDFGYEPICIFDDPEKAEQKANFLSKKAKQQAEIDKLYGRYVKEEDYVVHFVDDGTYTDDDDDYESKLDFQQRLKIAKEWRTQQDNQKQLKEQEARSVQLEKCYSEIVDFMDWMELHEHENNEKTTTRINANMSKIEFFLKHRFDKRVADMFQKLKSSPLQSHTLDTSRLFS